MSHHTDTFTTPDGLTLFEQWWRPDTPPKAAIIIVHGLGEHSGRYAYVAEHLVGQGYAVDALDLRGHGHSGGRRAFVRRFELLLDDVMHFLGRVQNRLPDTPIFLIGHSLGGTTITLLALTRQPPVQGFILSGAGLRFPVIPPLLKASAQILSICLPRLHTQKVAPNLITHDEALVQQYIADPLVFHGGVPARTGAELLSAAARIRSQMAAFDYPVLIMHGTADALTDPAGSQMLYDQAQSTDKTLELYEGFYHEVFNEVERGRVLADVVAWLDARNG